MSPEPGITCGRAFSRLNLNRTYVGCVITHTSLEPADYITHINNTSWLHHSYYPRQLLTSLTLPQSADGDIPHITTSTDDITHITTSTGDLTHMIQASRRHHSHIARASWRHHSHLQYQLATSLIWRHYSAWLPLSL